MVIVGVCTRVSAPSELHLHCSTMHEAQYGEMNEIARHLRLFRHSNGMVSPVRCAAYIGCMCTVIE